MKRIILAITAILVLVTTSCASLQEDVYYFSSDSEKTYKSIEEYENEFIKLDAAQTLNEQLSTVEINNLISKFEMYSHMEPALKARMSSLQGLLFLMQNKKSKAQELLKEGKAAQGNDSYVLVLSARLEKNTEAQLQALEKFLQKDDDNAILILEKAKTLYKLKDYDNAIVAIDKAFMILDSQGKNNYREIYSPVQKRIWECYSGDAAALNASNKPLTPAKSVELILKNTSLLNDYTGGKTLKLQDLIKNLEANNYFAAVRTTETPAPDFLKEKNVTNILCARILWNCYNINNQDFDSLTKYSNFYSSRPNLKSPISDVEVDNPDFDAVLGVIEKEFMELPDGKTFSPQETLTEAKFIQILEKVDSTL